MVTSGRRESERLTKSLLVSTGGRPERAALVLPRSGTVTRTSEALRHSNNGQALAPGRAAKLKETRMSLVLTLWLIYVPLLLALVWLMSKEDNT